MIIKQIVLHFLKFLPKSIRLKVELILITIKKAFAGNFWKQFILVKNLDLCDSIKFERLKCETNRYTVINSPQIIQDDLNIKIMPSIRGSQPNLELITFFNVFAVGHSLAVHSNGSLYQPELTVQDDRHDKKHILFYYSYKNGIVHDRLRCLFDSHDILQIHEAIHLLSEHSTNYYHWLFECLPRLIYFLNNSEQLQLSGNTVLLIDENLPKQCNEALVVLVENRFQVLKIRDVQQVKCSLLHYVTPLWYAFDNTINEPNFIKDFLVDRYAVSLLRASFCSYFTKKPPHKMIYLARRSSQVRNIINFKEVEALLLSFGFELIYTDNMGFIEQVKLFSETKFVIGASGASFSNMIFMQENTRSLMFSPSVKATNYYLFQQLADVANINFMHFLTTPSLNNQSIHSDFLINCIKLKEFLNILNNTKDIHFE